MSEASPVRTEAYLVLSVKEIREMLARALKYTEEGRAAHEAEGRDPSIACTVFRTTLVVDDNGKTQIETHDLTHGKL